MAKKKKKDVCLERSQIKTLFDVIRGKSECDAADEFIEEIDTEFEPKNAKKKAKKKENKTFWDKLCEEWL